MNKRIYLCLAHISGEEQKCINAFRCKYYTATLTKINDWG